MATLSKRILPFLVGLLMAAGCQAGWMNPSQPGFVIQTFTSYQPISGNNSGLILTNGNSYQVAGDNTGTIYIGGPGAQFRGKSDGNVLVDGDGAFVLGSFGSLAMVTNRGKGSLLLGNLSAGQRALITDVGNASLLLGAGTVSNSQTIVVGDGNVSHGSRSVTAGSFWATGSGFFGDGSGLAMPAFAGPGTTGTVTSTAGDAGKFLKAAGGWAAIEPTVSEVLARSSDAGRNTVTNLQDVMFRHELQICANDENDPAVHGILYADNDGPTAGVELQSYGNFDLFAREVWLYSDLWVNYGTGTIHGSGANLVGITAAQVGASPTGHTHAASAITGAPWLTNVSFAAIGGQPADNAALARATSGALAGTNDTWSKIEVGGLAIGYQNLSKVGDRSLLMGAYGSAMGQWAFGGGYFPVASDNMSFVWEGVGGQYTSHGSGTFNIRAPSIWFGETKVWDSYLGFTLPVPVANVTGGWTNRVDTKNLTMNGEMVEMKTMSFWAYATSNATAKTMFTVRYLGGTEVYIY